MPLLSRCWTPFLLYHWTNLRYGSFYAAMYTAVYHVLFIFYAIYAVTGGRTDYFFSPYFELSMKGIYAAAGCTMGFGVVFLIFTLMLVIGIKRDNRCLFFPWIISVVIEILLMIAVGLWYIGRYYRNLYSVLAAIILWCVDGVHVYCFMCVISHYQVVRDLQEPKFQILYP